MSTTEPGVRPDAGSAGAPRGTRATGKPVRVAILNDYEIVVRGLAATLQPYSEQVRLVELGSRTAVRDGSVDVVLYDTFAQTQGRSLDLDSLQADHVGAKIVLFTWNLDAATVDACLERGVAGYVSKSAGAAELVDALRRVADGERVRPPAATAVAPAAQPERVLGDWPGRDHGLTAREAEVLGLICQGLSNQQIAERTYLSINSVKTYIRTAYRRIAVTTRAQAVIWGLQHGFGPDRTRIRPPQD